MYQLAFIPGLILAYLIFGTKYGRRGLLGVIGIVILGVGLLTAGMTFYAVFMPEHFDYVAAFVRDPEEPGWPALENTLTHFFPWQRA